MIREAGVAGKEGMKNGGNTTQPGNTKAIRHNPRVSTHAFVCLCVCGGGGRGIGRGRVDIRVDIRGGGGGAG